MIEKQRWGILERARNKQFFTYNASSIRLTAISPQKTFTVLEKAYKPRSLYLAKLSFKNKGEIKTFTDKQNGRDFSLADLLTKILQ